MYANLCTDTLEARSGLWIRWNWSSRSISYMLELQARSTMPAHPLLQIKPGPVLTRQALYALSYTPRPDPCTIIEIIINLLL